MAKRGPRVATGASFGSAVRQVRCAIYTRKSTEEGLEQAFNSLDAQREACEAYIASQRHEGWTLVPAIYDDGGFSGGNMERPALKRLLADVESGRVDVIVVYKVDRLTRALSDFAKIVEVLDARGASFVSVTQAFNTTTSMGRLTLNVLLSFAQFEREVTGERIRDKIAASKRKGMWMGGPIPLGYDLHERKLLVNEAEATTVRLIFKRYVALGSIAELAKDLSRRGVTSKRRIMRDGRETGGEAYSKGALRYLLRNVLYTGRVPHGDQIYPGEHEAIVKQEMWDQAQALLAGNALRPPTGQTSILTGLLTDGHGRTMTAAHSIRGTRRYRYYVSRARDNDAQQTWRFPAGDLEAIVQQSLLAMFGDPLRVAGHLGCHGDKAGLVMRCADIARRVQELPGLDAMLEQLGTSVTVHQDRIDIILSARALAQLLATPAPPDDHPILLSTPVMLKRRGHELRL